MKKKMGKCDIYINNIIEHTGLQREEIEALAKEKKEDLKGLISDEGALFIISKELGVDMVNESSTFGSFELFAIKEVNQAGMKNLTLNGRVSKIYDVKAFMKKDGSDGKVLNFTIKDNESSITVVVWDDATDVINNPKFKKNALVQITRCYSKFNDYWQKIEVNLGKFSEIIFDPYDVKAKDYDEIEVVGDDW